MHRFNFHHACICAFEQTKSAHSLLQSSLFICITSKTGSEIPLSLNAKRSQGKATEITNVNSKRTDAYKAQARSTVQLFNHVRLVVYAWFRVLLNFFFCSVCSWSEKYYVILVKRGTTAICCEQLYIKG